MQEMMNTREVAEYLGIHEKQVYSLIKSEKIPCTRVTGKWIFPKYMIDKWISDSASLDPIPKNSSKRNFILAAGSNDPILDILISNTKENFNDFNIFSSSTGSTEGLKLLSKGEVDLAWCHIFDSATGEYNIPFVTDYFTDNKIVIVHLFSREQGFVVSKNVEDKIKGFKDLTDNEIIFANRQVGSGTRIFIDYELEKAGVDSSKINGYEDQLYTHFEVGLSVKSNVANVGVATIAISKLFDLPFIPIVKESFDMVMPQDIFFKKEVQLFIETLNSDKCRSKIEPLGDYDFSNTGKILYTT